MEVAMLDLAGYWRRKALPEHPKFTDHIRCHATD
jgi:hypothetical protein